MGDFFPLTKPNESREWGKNPGVEKTEKTIYSKS